MKLVTHFTNRLGNRAVNQDRCLVINQTHKTLLVVADGMGGHARGELAAQTAVESMAENFERIQGRMDDPQRFLRMAIHHAHLDIIRAGRQQQPPVDPRTVCVACVVQDHQAWWAHVGDSRLYLLRNGSIAQRTRDHTPLEDMLQRGEIDEDAAKNHPLRNNVNRCLGGNSVPRISFACADLEKDDMLVLCSDGLWSALTEQQLTALQKSKNLEHGVNQLAEAAERASYPHSDNISLIALQSLGHRPTVTPLRKKPDNSDRTTDKTSGKDPVQQAIDNINRAIIDYASEMKKF